MAFGFFKKRDTADIVFHNGTIYTQTADVPTVGAVAVKGGNVLAVGDIEGLEEYITEDTAEIDLEGGYMLPGFINTCAHPVMMTYEKLCIPLDTGMSRDEILRACNKYIRKHPNRRAYLAYGYDEHKLLAGDESQFRDAIIGICPDKPFVGISRNGYHAWLNKNVSTLAMSVVEEETRGLDEDDPRRRAAITLPFVLSLIDPFNEGEEERAFADTLFEFASHGFTTVQNTDAPELFDNMFRDMILRTIERNAERVRYFGTLDVSALPNTGAMIGRLRQKRTSCLELGQLVNFDTVLVSLYETEDGGLNIDPDALSEALNAVCDYGFNITVNAYDKKAADAALDVLESVRGSYKKNVLTLAHDGEFTEEELTDRTLGEAIYEGVLSGGRNAVNDLFISVSEAEDTEEAIDALTIEGAVLLGKDDDLGSIEPGKAADFAIFDNDPFACDVDQLKKLKCVMTVVGGQITYDASEDTAREWAETLTDTYF